MFSQTLAEMDFKRNAISVVFLLPLLQQFFVASQAPEPGYLDFDNLPETNFSCEGKVIGGYYADVETGCQMFHVCTIGQKGEVSDIKFLCLNGTVFDQETRVCERLDEVDCSKTEAFYDLNLELYGNNPAVGSHSDDDSDVDDDENKSSADEREEVATEAGDDISGATPTVSSTTTTPPPTNPAPPPTTTAATTVPTAQPPVPSAPAASNFPNTLNALLALHNALQSSIKNGHQQPSAVPERATTLAPRPTTPPTVAPAHHSTLNPPHLILGQLTPGHHFPAVESHRQKHQQQIQEQLLREQLQFQQHHQQLQQHQLHQQKQQQQQQVMQQRQQQQQQRQQQQQQHQQQQELLKETQQKVRAGSSTPSPSAHSHVTHLTSHHVANVPAHSRPGALQPIGYSPHVPSTSRPPLFGPVVPPQASPPAAAPVPRPKPAVIPFRPFHPASSSTSASASVGSTTPVPDPASSYLLHQLRVPSQPARPSSSYFVVRDEDDRDQLVDAPKQAFSTTINHPTSKPGGSGPPARSSFSFKPFSTPAVAIVSSTRTVSASSGGGGGGGGGGSPATGSKKASVAGNGNKSAQDDLPKEQEFIKRFNPDAPAIQAPSAEAEATGPDTDSDVYEEYDDDVPVDENDDTYFGDVPRVVDKPRRERRDLGLRGDVEDVPGVHAASNITHLPQVQPGRRRGARVRGRPPQQSDVADVPVPAEPQVVHRQRPTSRYSQRTSAVLPGDTSPGRRVPASTEEPEPTTAPPVQQKRRPVASRSRSRGGQRYAFMDDPLIARKAAAAAEAAEPSTTTTPAPLPETSFTCSDKVAGGFYADTDADCQLFHICSQTGADGSLTDNKFFCGPGTRFNQRSRTCQARDLVDCRLSARYYSLNSHFKIPPPEEDVPVPAFDAHRLTRRKRATSRRTSGRPTEAAEADPDDGATSFECASAGLFADVSSGCEKFHLCETKGSAPLSSFRCPSEQLFNQRLGACDSADLVECDLLSVPEHEFHRSRGHKRHRRSTPVLLSVRTEPKDSVRFYFADYEDAVPIDSHRPNRQPASSTEPTAPDEYYDYEEAPVSTVLPPTKSVSYYLYAAKDEAPRDAADSASPPLATRSPDSLVPEDYVDDNYEGQSPPQTPSPPRTTPTRSAPQLVDYEEDLEDRHVENQTTTNEAVLSKSPVTPHTLSTTPLPQPPIKPQPQPLDKPEEPELVEYDYSLNDYDETTKGDVLPKDKQPSVPASPDPHSSPLTKNSQNLELTYITEATTPLKQTSPTTSTTSIRPTSPPVRPRPNQGRPVITSRPPNRTPSSRTRGRLALPKTERRDDISHELNSLSTPTDSSEPSSTTPFLPLSESPETLSHRPVSQYLQDSFQPLPSPPVLNSITTTTISTEPLTAANLEANQGPPSTVPPTSSTVPTSDPFVCTGRELNKFHRDHLDCRMFHYCTPGYSAEQVLDFRFECVDGTSYDEAENRCQVPAPGQCVR